MHAGMSENRQGAQDDLIIGWLVYGLLVLLGLIPLVASFNERLAFALLGAPIGATAIFVFVRWMNRRNDPRHAKLPPDDP